MNKLLSIATFVILTIPVYGQNIQLSRQVISSAGGSGSGSYFLDYTVGQPEYTTGSSSNYALTQGFQQPSFKDELVVDLVVEQPGCINDGLGSIGLAGLSSCSNDDPEVFIDGEPSEFPIIGLEPGEYLLTIHAGFNCGYEELIQLSENEGLCDLIFYNTITPNNDGFNDTWEIENIEEYNNGQNEVRIINRWGLEVFKAFNYGSNGTVWDGRDKDGQVLADGTYFYFVSIGSNEFTGYIELLR